MIIVRFVTLLILITVALQASYSYKKIIVASFPSQRDADRTLKKIEQQLYSNDSISMLQQEHHFNLISRASGKYFIISVEPFAKKEVLNRVLHDVKKIRKDAFVNRFVSETDLFIPKQNVIVPEVQEKVTQVTIPKEVVEPEIIRSIAVLQENPSTVVSSAEVVELPVPEPKPLLLEEEIDMSEPSVLSLVQNVTTDMLYWMLALHVLALIVLSYMLIGSQKRSFKLKNKNNTLQDLLQQKDELFAKYIHELRTPIHGIIGLTHLLKESDIGETYANSIDKISKSSDRMLQLVNDLLDLSKLEAKKIGVEHIEFDLNDVLESLSDNIGIEANKKGLDFLYQVENCLPKKYIGDPLRISQILLNLISNAIKFTLKGGVYLKIRELERAQEFITLEFEVEDSGIGLTQDQINNAFELFSQSESSTSRVYGGTGLGLAISKELVELMGGEISCQKAKKSDGACFVFTIKLQMLNPKEQRIYRLPSKSMMFKRVFIVDTNEQSIEFLSHKLEYFHYNIAALPSLSDVIKKDTGFDLLFLDELYFNESAISSLDAIKAAHPVKIILVETLYNKMKNSKIAFRFDYRIIKPFTQQRIVDMVVEIFSEQKNILSKPKERITVKEQLSQLSASKILLAEDNEINQKVILGLLKKTPIEVVIANNGLEAVEKLKKHNDIVLIFMDLSMPVMDGYTATKQIKKMPKYEETPIVALSANVMSEEMEKILKVGMEEYLPKPFEMDKFYTLLLRYLS